MTAYLLLCPATPMLFMGQEFAASTPFLYFADHEPELAEQVSRGRKDFLAQFPSIESMKRALADPHDSATFARCKLDHGERETNESIVALHRDLLRLRPTMPRRLDGAVLGGEAFLLRFFGTEAPDRLLLINLGRELILSPGPEPLLAPPAGCRWRLLWSSEDPRYGGAGISAPESEETGWRLTGQAAVLMEAVHA
jgi:maltooligosyltrehalose trehalohydrolase